MEVQYLDTGVFVTPLLQNREPAVIQACEEWLSRAARGEFQAVTSYLTWDEVTHVAARVPKPYSYARAQRASALLLGLRNLRFIPVDEAVVRTAERLLSSLKPRDAIHVASAVLHAGGHIVTLDGDFAAMPPEAARPLTVVRIG